MIAIPLAILAYLVIGLIFAVPFAFVGAKKIDPAAVEGSFCFRLLIIPGSVVFWPLLLKRWLKGEHPVEKSAHRSAAES
jgi:hypothetical protein